MPSSDKNPAPGPSSRRSNRAIRPPTVVVRVQDALTSILGRAATVRRMRNGRDWFIYDPIFSHIQRAAGSGATGYRAGLYYQPNQNLLAFYIVHAPVMARIFKANWCTRTVLSLVKATKSYRDLSHMFWSTGAKSGTDQQGTRILTYATFAAFERAVLAWDAERGFATDLFPGIARRARSPNPRLRAGHDFGLLLATKVRSLSDRQIQRLVEKAWPVFAMLYPNRPVERRDAVLARNLTKAGIPRRCEVRSIDGLERLVADVGPCQGRIEGAHIIPHARGGSDRASNGLWLCEYHHRRTEGRLVGDRNEPRVKLR